MKPNQARSLVTAAVTVCIILGLAIPASASSPPPAALGAGAGSKPYILFHLDAISSEVFFEMLDSGLLPNISALFSDGVIIPCAVSPFAPGTEMVYPRMKRGTPVNSDDSVAWKTINRYTGGWKTWFQNFLSLWQWFPRYTLTEASIGAIFEPVSALSIVNIPRMLRDFGIVEFFWFATDAVGHLQGIEAQKASVARFDALLRPVLDYVRTSPDGVNVVLYCDHGMSMIEEYVDTEPAMEEVAGERAVLCFYPNMYLADPTCAPEVGRKLAARHEVDFAFWREGDARIAGGHDHGTVLFDYDDEHVSYTYLGDDPFGYCDLGYRGEPLTDAEWLELTCRSLWPAVPVQIVRYMQSEESGDVIVIVNPPKGMPSVEGYVAGHKGVAASDCTVPVLMTGPDIALNPVPESIWLHKLHNEVLRIDALAPERSVREPHRLTVSPFGANLTLSPVPNLLLHAELSGDDSVFLCETDLFRSFNTRVWVGAGILGHGGGPAATTAAAASARLEVFINRLVVDWRMLRSEGKADQRLSATYETQSGFTVHWSFPNQIGLGLTW